MSNVVDIGKAKYPRRFYGECQRCQRTDYLPWATEHGERYCGWCHEKDALDYARSRGWRPPDHRPDKGPLFGPMDRKPF